MRAPCPPSRDQPSPTSGPTRKVRDVYDLGDSYLFVATDRISAFDVVLSPGIRGQGQILTQISTFWFRHFADIENHLLDADWETFPAKCGPIPICAAAVSSSGSAQSSPSNASPVAISSVRG